MAVSKPGWHLARRSDISEVAWKALLDRSPDHAIFSQLWLLDAVGEDSVYAAIYDDYQAGVPLMVAKKGCFTLALAPLWVSYLGPLGNLANQEVFCQLQRFLKTRFTLYALPMAPEASHLPKYYARPTFILDLSRYTQPEKHHQRQLRKAKESGLIVRERGDAEAFTDFFWNIRGGRVPGFKPYHRERLLSLTQEAIKMRSGYCAEAITEQGEVVAMVYFLLRGSTAYFLDGTANEQGRSCGAMFLLIHEGLIRHKESGIKHVDFCGSKDPGVARFYKGFGADMIEVPLLTGGWLWPFLPVQLRKRFL
jgi:hypothetical protein